MNFKHQYAAKWEEAATLWFYSRFVLGKILSAMFDDGKFLVNTESVSQVLGSGWVGILQLLTLYKTSPKIHTTDISINENHVLSVQVTFPYFCYILCEYGINVRLAMNTIYHLF